MTSPTGPPIEFTDEPEPGVRDYNGALLRHADGCDCAACALDRLIERSEGEVDAT